MCGIISYKGPQNCYPILLNGLKRLEYRGYDSAGIVSLYNNQLLQNRRVGKVQVLEKEILSSIKINSNLGIAHTRWATHGKPSNENAHPHLDDLEDIALVHNGIIENYSSLKDFLINKGFSFKSETDTEVVVQLISYFIKDQNLEYVNAIYAALELLEGAFAVVILNKNFPDMLIGARKSSPLLLGIGKNEFFFASDASAIVEHTNQIVYLEDHEMCIINGNTYEINDFRTRESLEKIVDTVHLEIEDIEKGIFDYFMHKEIHDQQQTIINTIRGRSDKENVFLNGLSSYWNNITNSSKMYITACGTSWHSALIAKIFIERFAKIPVIVDYASEFRYNDSPIDSSTCVIAISQSGETADTLAAIIKAKELGATTVGICNVPGSSISRETHCGVFTRCGSEIGVASTKAFTAQITILYLLAIKLGQSNNTLSKEEIVQCLDFSSLSENISKVLLKEKNVKEVATKYCISSDFLYLGRGINFPIALEGALKLKEISYIHAEGYPAAEMKHGPIALIDKNMPTVFLVSKDKSFDKILSNIEEVKSRKGIIIAITDSDDKKLLELCDDIISVPQSNEFIFGILSTIVLQLFAFFIAVEKGCDVDQPRNLAKSVTVE
jgi:glucosamine--fructose-6-phosphate aminotransferase (isomerizing)